MKEPIAPEPGRLAVSRAGRDKGRTLIVIREEAPFVYVADGDLRKIANAKKKKRMHLSMKPHVADAIAGKLRAGQTVFDHELRAAIEAYCEPHKQ